MKIFKLKFKSSIHIGQREGFLESTEEIIHSDTLFSAFCNSYLLLYGENKLSLLLENFKNGSPPFYISSCFPYINEKLFFPVPLNQFPKEKNLKKIKFIEKEIFELLLTGKKIDNLKDKIDKIDFCIISKTPRVALGRLNNHPGENFFYFGEVYFKEEAGLYFLIEFKEKEYEKEFISTLRLLGDEGLGGDRTVGKGLFEIKGNDEFKIKLPENPDGYITLSLLSPKENEIFYIKEGFYEIIERKGYISSPFTKSLRRKNIRLIKEASVFQKMIEGKLVDVTPAYFKGHSVFRYGFPLNLPIKFEANYEN